MKKEIIERIKQETARILETKETVRELAKHFKLSKSTIHKDLHERLLELDKDKYLQVQKIMNHHISIRHIRGGNSTKLKYLQK